MFEGPLVDELDGLLYFKLTLLGLGFYLFLFLILFVLDKYIGGVKK